MSGERPGASLLTFDVLGQWLSIEIDDPAVMRGHPLVELPPRPPSLLRCARDSELWSIHCGDMAIRDGLGETDIAPIVEHLLVEYARARTKATMLHAAMVSDGTAQAIVICGDSGAGKSTLALGLAAADYTAWSDDIVAIGEDGRAIAWRRWVSLDGSDMTPASRGWGKLFERRVGRWQDVQRTWRRTERFAAFADTSCEPMTARAVVIVRAGTSARWQALDRWTAIERIGAHRLGGCTQSHLQVATSLSALTAGATIVAELVTGSPEETLRALLAGLCPSETPVGEEDAYETA